MSGIENDFFLKMLKIPLSSDLKVCILSMLKWNAEKLASTFIFMPENNIDQTQKQLLVKFILLW